ncbi:MAG: von Willebrand factor type A domain-containing protein [Planctomycetaceae bacterium]|nr:von Willebrand factor type A domain-containing protein [Planctomycetaceae bacterium]
MIDKNDPKLTAFALGELTGDEQIEVNAEVCSSAELRVEVDEIRRIADAIGEIMLAEQNAEQPRNITPKNSCKINPKNNKQNNFVYLTSKFLFLTSAVVLLLCVIIVTIMSQNYPRTTANLPNANSKTTQNIPKNNTTNTDDSKASDVKNPNAIKEAIITAPLSDNTQPAPTAESNSSPTYEIAAELDNNRHIEIEQHETFDSTNASPKENAVGGGKIASEEELVVGNFLTQENHTKKSAIMLNSPLGMQKLLIDPLSLSNQYNSQTQKNQLSNTRLTHNNSQQPAQTLLTIDKHNSTLNPQKNDNNTTDDNNIVTDNEVVKTDNITKTENQISRRKNARLLAANIQNEKIEPHLASRKLGVANAYNADQLVAVSSYKIMRNALTKGELPPANSVKIEEYVNNFNYNFPAVSDKDSCVVLTDFVKCAWNPKNLIARVSVKKSVADKKSESVDSEVEKHLQENFKVVINFDKNKIIRYEYLGNNKTAKDKIKIQSTTDCFDVHEINFDGGVNGAGDGVTFLYEVVLSDSVELDKIVSELPASGLMGVEIAKSAGAKILPKEVGKSSKDTVEFISIDLPKLANASIRGTSVDVEIRGETEFAVAVVLFGMLLSDDSRAAGCDWDTVKKLAEQNVKNDKDRKEFLDLIKRAASIKINK